MSQQINLLDPSLLPPRDWFTGLHIISLATLLALGVLAHAALETWAMKRLRASDAFAAAEAAPPAPEPTPAEDTATNRVQRNRALLAAVNGLTDLPRDTAHRITALTGALPAAVWLREVEFSGQRNIRIAGGTLEPQALAALSSRLGATDAFRDQPLRVFSLAPLTAAEDTGASAPPAFSFVLSSVDRPEANLP